MKRICFMGTPVFACGILQRLIDDNYHVVAVVSQPDKKTGRKQQLTMTPVKELALKHNIEVFQPESIKECSEWIKEKDLDLIITCAYGQFIPDSILNAPRHGSINVHASILPKYRGGAPIHKCIIQGESESGVSIMRMVKKMDAGAVCHVKKVDITQDDTMGSLHDKLMVCGADALMEVLEDILNDKAVFIEQDESLATYAWNVSKEEEFIDFNKNDQQIYDHIRGLIPVPVGYAMIDGKKMKFHEVSMLDEKPKRTKGTIMTFDKQGMKVALDDHVLCIKSLQMEGKGKVSAYDFGNGQGRSLIGKSFL